MAKFFFIIGIMCFAGSCTSMAAKDREPLEKPKCIWIDLAANRERFNDPDSIGYYVKKCKEVGITHLIVDLKGTSGEVCYPSKIAPMLSLSKGSGSSGSDPTAGSSEGVNKRSHGSGCGGFDFADCFIQAARAHKMKIFASLNIFCEGNGVHRRGIVYDTHKDWQSVNYVPGKGLIPVTEISGKVTAFVNPAIPEVQKYERSILAEVVRLYPFDGIILDRARYDGIQSDFSEFSRRKFEAFAGTKLQRFPEDIFEWVPDGRGGYECVEGRLFKKWIEWRASVIYYFIRATREALKAIRPDLQFGAYTGAWYPTSYEYGTNWAAGSYNSSADFDWATPDYRHYAYGDLLDVYMNGNYYWNIHMRDDDPVERLQAHPENAYRSVEGGCVYTRRLLDGRPFYSGIYVHVYGSNAQQFKKAVGMSLKIADGLMIFDISHLINNNWWDELSEIILMNY